MPYQFTQNPTQGQVDILPNGRKFQFNAGHWDLFTNTLPENVAPVVMTQMPILSETEPPVPNSNPFWFEPMQGKLFVQVQPDPDKGPVWMPSMEVQSASPLESETPPELPNTNPYWFKPSSSVMHYQYNDGNSTQWVEI